MHIGRPCLSLLAALLLSACDTPECAPRTLVYTPPDWPQPLSADLCRPQSADEPPVVVLIHGGGWHSGRRQHMARFADALSARGYASLSIDYRLVPQHRHPAQLEDVQQALAWLRQQGDTLQLDVQRIALWGYSAGAHLAAMAALSGDGPHVSAVIAGGMPAELSKMADDPQVRNLFGAGFADAPQRYEQASPLLQVHARAPPMFLYHARWDRVVDPAQARSMKSALDRAGVPVQLRWLHAHGHVTGFFFPGGVREAAIDFLDRYLRDGA